MRALWEEVEVKFKYPQETPRADIYALIDSSETGALEWFGQMHEVETGSQKDDSTSSH
jgi:hypothetical protein